MLVYKLRSVQLASHLSKESTAVMKCSVPGVTTTSATGAELILPWIQRVILGRLVTSMETERREATIVMMMMMVCKTKARDGLGFLGHFYLDISHQNYP